MLSSAEETSDSSKESTLHTAPKSIMTHPVQQYRLNVPLAVAEVIDGEAVIMNMESGHYFSARGLAGVLWEWTIAGHSVGAMFDVVAAKWPVDGVAESVSAFVDTLAGHNLIVPTAATTPSAPPEIAALNMPAYVAPSLDVFTDMKDLLLLDPIHDVGEAGWPMPLQQRAAGPT